MTFFQTFWDRIDGDDIAPMHDELESFYDEWTYKNMYYWGMRDRANNQPHGIIRFYTETWHYVLEAY